MAHSHSNSLLTVPSLLIVPGLGGSDDDHWQSHIERSRSGAERVHQLDWDRPDLRTWLEQLHRAVERNPHSVLVAHSLGCVLVAHFARRYPEAPVAGAFLVAPADVDFPEQLPINLIDFAPTPLGRLPFPATLVASTNDPFMSFARAKELADCWGSTLVNLRDSGHINIDSGFGRWPQGEALLDDLLNSVSSRLNAATSHAGEPHRHHARG